MLLGAALESPTDEWDRTVALNVHGSSYVTRAALPHLVHAAENSPREVADLVNISSTAGRVARPGGSIYSLTTFGIAARAASLREELVRTRVRRRRRAGHAGLWNRFLKCLPGRFSGGGRRRRSGAGRRQC
jgi:NADP-dependent 3-hydroxy acid dehydrogenase YdfG